MEKAMADFLAYELTKARLTHSDLPLNQESAQEIAQFIQKLSSELKNSLGDIDVSAIERFKHLSK